jgi:hypothetical protein
MKNQKLITKAGLICLSFQLLGSLTSSAQVTEYPHIIKPDTLVEIAMFSGNSATWDFSGLNLDTYQNTIDSDLVHGINPISIYGDANLNSLNDSIIGATREKIYTEKEIQMRRHGNYVMIAEGSGTLKTRGMLFTDVKKVKLTERYFHTINNNDVVTYVNTYYLFFKGDTKELLFSVFNKKRNLNQFIGWEFNGIKYDKAKSFATNPGENPLQLALSPNPAGAQTELSYTLINNASVSIEVLNQNNTINNVVYSGNKNAGVNHVTIPLNSYSAGIYTVKITVDGRMYATTLIIE